MSKKHNQLTRAQILAKRNTPIVEIPVQKKVLAPNGQTLYVPQPSTPNADVRRASRSKYTPHFGAKQAVKLRGAVGELLAA